VDASVMAKQQPFQFGSPPQTRLFVGSRRIRTRPSAWWQPERKEAAQIMNADSGEARQDAIGIQRLGWGKSGSVLPLDIRSSALALGEYLPRAGARCSQLPWGRDLHGSAGTW